MASILDNPSIRNAALSISVEQYHDLGRAGIIAENTELLRGVIVEKLIKSPKHTWTVQRLVDWLVPRVQTECYARKEEPLTLEDSEPEPDVAVVNGCADDYLTSHPQTACLVIEVAITSEEVDREKAKVYANGNVAEYWLVLPDKGIVEVFRDPSATGYAHRQRYAAGDSIAVIRFPHLSFPVNHLLTTKSE